MTRITLIAALSRNDQVIGKDGDLPWRLSSDLKRFKSTTIGHPIVMGRKTYESIGRPLPGRRNIVLSRSVNFSPDGVEIARSLDDALQLVCTDDVKEAFIIGGEAVYADALGRADRLVLTWVDGEFEGDAFFPKFDDSDWIEQSREPVHADDRNSHETEVVILDRRRGV